jgi:hypothetical protein
LWKYKEGALLSFIWQFSVRCSLKLVASIHSTVTFFSGSHGLISEHLCLLLRSYWVSSWCLRWCRANGYIALRCLCLLHRNCFCFLLVKSKTFRTSHWALSTRMGSTQIDLTALGSHLKLLPSKMSVKLNFWLDSIQSSKLLCPFKYKCIIYSSVGPKLRSQGWSFLFSKTSIGPSRS